MSMPSLFPDDGTLKPPSELIRNDGAHANLHLPARHIIDRPKKALDGIQGWAPRKSPTVAQVLDSLREDGERHDAHIPRLISLVDQGVETDDICNLPCIPFNGKLFAPSDLALRGRRDYWGDWKTVMPVPSTNAEVQNLYRKVGVVGGQPTPSLVPGRFSAGYRGRAPAVIGRAYRPYTSPHWSQEMGRQ